MRHQRIRRPHPLYHPENLVKLVLKLRPTHTSSQISEITGISKSCVKSLWYRNKCDPLNPEEKRRRMVVGNGKKRLPGPLRVEILKVLKESNRPMSCPELNELIDTTRANLRQIMFRMKQDGLIELSSRGCYVVKEKTNDQRGVQDQAAGRGQEDDSQLHGVAANGPVHEKDGHNPGQIV